MYNVKNKKQFNADLAPGNRNVAENKLNTNNYNSVVINENTTCFNINANYTSLY